MFSKKKLEDISPFCAIVLWYVLLFQSLSTSARTSLIYFAVVSRQINLMNKLTQMKYLMNAGGISEESKKSVN